MQTFGAQEIYPRQPLPSQDTIGLQLVPDAFLFHDLLQQAPQVLVEDAMAVVELELEGLAHQL